MSGRFKYFAIFGSMRSGSNLLEQTLNQFSGITCHGELFNPSFVGYPKQEGFLGIGLEQREKSPESLIKAMIEDSMEGIAGFRIFHDHDPRTAQFVLADPDCAKIILQRDVLQSFISLEIARKTDQWMLRKAHNRRGAKVIFEAEKFESYRAQQESYYASVRETLQRSGQTAFWVTYPEQRDIGVVNGIARYLGHEEKLKAIKDTTLRQNPESLREKVENFDEMQATLSLSTEDSRVQASHIDTTRRANIPKMVSCITEPILFVPVPGGPNEEVLRWMYTLDGGDAPQPSYTQAVADGQFLHTGHNQRTLFEWMDSNPDLVTVSAVRHPLARAYDAFMTKIFPTGGDTYGAIRQQLIQHFEVPVPDVDLMEDVSRATLEDAGYGIGQHRAAFHAFLRFLKDNLSDQTSIRKDGLWDSQMSFFVGFNTAVPISVIAKEGQMDAAFAYVETILDLPKPMIGMPIQPDHMFTLDEIYTRQTENLTRKAYKMDYIRFGFADYQAALDA